MNSIGFVIVTIVLATIAMLCGIKLFDLNSELSEPIYKYGPFIGIIFAVFAAFGLILPDVVEVTDNVPLIIAASIAAFLLIGAGLTTLRRYSLSIRPNNKRAKKRLPRGGFVGVCAVDTVEGIFAGFAAGASFLFNSGAGIVALCAMVMLQISTKVAAIREYQDSGATRKQNMAVLLASSIANIAAAISTYLLARGHINIDGVLASIGIGFILYRAVVHLWLIVKRFQNR